MKILCCGFFPALQRTIEYKGFRPYEVNRACKVSVAASGKATNTARVLKQLGAAPLMLSFAGGANGETIRGLLEQEGLPCRWVETVAESRICQTLLAKDHDGCTELVEESPPLTTKEWKTFVKTFAEIQADFDRIIFSGNLPAHAPQDIYAELISRTDGDKVLIDSSGAPLLTTLPQQPSIVKLNAEELALTIKAPTGDSGPTKKTVGRVRTPGEIREMAEELIAQGARTLGVTQGKDSAMLITPEGVYRFTIPQINTVNPIGSGDAVSAGTAYALTKGSPLTEAFAFGLACGTSNAMNLAPGHVEPEQIAELVPRIEIL